MNTQDGITRIHTPGLAIAGSLSAVILIGVLAVGFIGLTGLLVWQTQIVLAAIFACLTAFMVAMCLYVLKDLSGKWGWRVEVSPDSVSLNLPSHRSLIHHLPTVRRTIPAQEVAGIEQRLESYLSMGMGQMQRAHVLRLTSGEAIFLGEDRAIATGMESSLAAWAAAEIATLMDKPVTDLGMVAGQGGFLGALFTAPAPWDAEALPPDAVARMWRRVALTGLLTTAAPIIVLVAALVSIF